LSAGHFTIKKPQASYELLQKEFCREAADFEQEWENLVLYYLRTYLLGALYDDDVYGKIKSGSFQLCGDPGMVPVPLPAYGNGIHRIIDSRLLSLFQRNRNSDENLNELEQMLGENPLFYLESMMTVVCGAKTS